MNYEINGRVPVTRSRYGYAVDSDRESVPRCAFWKKVAVLAAIVAVYAAVQLAISWPAITWMIKHRGTEAQRPSASSVSPCLCVKTINGGIAS